MKKSKKDQTLAREENARVEEKCASEKATLQERIGELEKALEKALAQQPTTPIRRAPRRRRSGGYGVQFTSHGAVSSTGVDTQTSGGEESESDYETEEDTEMSDDESDYEMEEDYEMKVNCFVRATAFFHAHCSFLLTGSESKA
jgi:hypothetical protein